MKGSQRYKIYINSTKVLLIPSSDLDDSIQRDDEHLVARYNGGVKHLMNYVDMFEKTSRVKQVVIHYPDYDKLEKDFHSLFLVVEAGGGVVRDENKNILFIHRRGHWDLPKGKLEEGETIEEASVREVEEETGISDVKIVKKLRNTHHVYRKRNGKRCIKLTHWYIMDTHNQPLVGQVEEGIEKAEWRPLEDTMDVDNIYANINDLLHSYKEVIDAE